MRSCSKYHNKDNGSLTNIDEALKKTIEDAIKEMADKALRTICLAYKELQGNEDLVTKDNLGVYDVETKDLVLMGIFGIADVIRPEVPNAVQ